MTSPWAHLVGGVRIPRRDHAFPIVAASRPVGALPPRAFPILGRSQYQSRANACLPHAVAAALEADVLARTGADFQVSIQDAYFGYRWLQHEETQDNGSYPSDASAWHRDYGTVSSVRAPYNPTTVTTWRPSAEWAGERRMLTADLQPLPAVAAQIKGELAGGRCVVVCHLVYGQMTGQAATTGVETGNDGGAVLGGHGRSICGYDDEETIPGFPSGVFYIWNSWKGWGKPHPLAASDVRFAGIQDSVSKIPQTVLVSDDCSFDLRRIARGLSVEM